MMAKQYFESCRNCKPPKRKPGCHGTCPEYREDREAWDRDKERIDAEKEKDSFLKSIERKRDLRISKLKR